MKMISQKKKLKPLSLERKKILVGFGCAYVCKCMLRWDGVMEIGRGGDVVLGWAGVIVGKMMWE